MGPGSGGLLLTIGAYVSTPADAVKARVFRQQSLKSPPFLCAIPNTPHLKQGTCTLSESHVPCFSILVTN